MLIEAQYLVLTPAALHGQVYVATSVAGPYKLAGKGPGGNPAPLYHNGQWYATTQRTTQVVTTTHLGGDW